MRRSHQEGVTPIRTVITGVVFLAGAAGYALAQPTSAAVVAETQSASQPIRSLVIMAAPTTEQGLREYLALVRECKGRWKGNPATRPVTTTQAVPPSPPMPTDGAGKTPEGNGKTPPAENAERELWITLTALEQEVLRQLEDLQQITELKKPEQQEGLARQVRAFTEEGRAQKRKWEPLLPSGDETEAAEKARVAKLLNRLREEGLTGEALDKAIQKADVAHNDAVSRIASQAGIQTQRGQELLGLPAKLKTASDTMQQVRRALLTYRADLPSGQEEGTEGSVQKGVMQLLMEAKAGLAVLRSGGLGLRQTRLEMERTYDEQWIDALRQKVEGLRLERIAYQQAKAAAELKEVQAQQQEPLRPYEKTYLDAKQLELETRQWFSKLEAPARNRLAKMYLDHLKSSAKDQRAYWVSIGEAMDTWSGLEIRRAYREIREAIAEETARVAQLQTALNDTLGESSAAHRRRNEVHSRYAELTRRFEREIQGATDESAVRASAKWAELKPGFGTISVMGRIVDLQEDLMKRLREALQTSKDYLTFLEQMRSRLFWAYVRVRDRGVFDPGMVGEIRSELDEVLNAERSPFHTLWNDLREQITRTGVWERIGSAVLLITSAWLGVFVRKQLRAWSDAREKSVYETVRDDEMTSVPLHHRLQIQGSRVLARSSVLAFPLIAGFAVCLLVGMEGTAGRVCLTLLVYLLGIRLAFATVNGLFRPTRPRLRLMQCTNLVATYWWKWWRRMLWVAVFTMPAPLLLRSLNTLPLIEAHLWHMVLVIFLALLIVFLCRRDAVLGVAGRARRERPSVLGTMAVGSYPVVVFAVAALLILLVVGYRALAVYIFWGALWTSLVLLATTALTHSLADLGEKYRQRARRQIKAAAEEEEPATDEAEAERARTEYARNVYLALALLASVLRWVARGVALVLVLRVWGVSLVDVDAVLDLQLVASPDRPVTIWRVVAGVLTMVGSVLLSRAIRSSLRMRVYPAYPNLDRGAQAAIDTLTHYMVLGLGMFAGLQVVHVNLAALTVLFGTVGLGLGLGLQPLFVNFLSGLVILLERHVKVGDKVEVGGVLGEVTDIRMRATCVKTYDNVDMVIPNSEFITSKVVNWTLQDEIIRATVDVGVAYGTDTHLVERLLVEVAKESPLVLSDPAPSVAFLNFGDNSLDFRMYAWCRNTRERWEFLNSARHRIIELFGRHGIDIPFPQRTLSTLGDRPLKISMVDPAAEKRESGGGCS